MCGSGSFTVGMWARLAPGGEDARWVRVVEVLGCGDVRISTKSGRRFLVPRTWVEAGWLLAPEQMAILL